MLHQDFFLCIYQKILNASDFSLFIQKYEISNHSIHHFYIPHFSYLMYPLNLPLMYTLFFRSPKNNFSIFSNLPFVTALFSQTHKHTQYFLDAQNPYNYM